MQFFIIIAALDSCKRGGGGICADQCTFKLILAVPNVSHEWCLGSFCVSGKLKVVYAIFFIHIPSINGIDFIFILPLSKAFIGILLCC